MKIWLATFLCLAAMGASHNTHAQGIGFSGFSGIGKPGFSLNGSPIVGPPPVTHAPVSIMPPQVVGLDYPNNGVSTALTGTTLTLTADDGQWSNSPTTLSRAWHTINAPATPLGTGSTLTIDIAATPAIVGQAIELNTTATNAIGSTTQMSHWFGPIEAAAPAQPVPSYEDKTQDFGNGVGNPPSTIPLPVSPVHFLQNGHAIYPGCNIPPVAPNTTPTNVWYFDPIDPLHGGGGRTQAQMTSNSDGFGTVAAIDQGHIGHPFLDISALFNPIANYASSPLFGFGRTILPGATIYVKPGDATHQLTLQTNSPEYSTDNGTTTGNIIWTWILPDPAAATLPIFNLIKFGNGNGGAAGFILKGVNHESAGVSPSFVFSGGITTPVHDMIVENTSISSWLGHSTDPWLPSTYPTTGGTSDGTIVSASPMTTAEDPLTDNVSGSGTTLSLVSGTAPTVGTYIWSPGLFRSTPGGAPVPVPGASGIPNGTKVTAVAGSTITIAACDPVTDASTGCALGGSYTFVPACDPKTTPTAGGCIGTPTAWAGTTRALSNELVSYTDRMQVHSAAGMWNSTDWADGGDAGIAFVGAVDGANSQVPSLPNLYKGANCLSAKDNTVREVGIGISFGKVTNAIAYNNRVKWYSQDGYDIYSAHRTWMIHNWASDNTQVWAHQDGMQFATYNGGVDYVNYSDAAIENEVIQQTDQTNVFARFEQGISNTDNWWWGEYLATNIIYATGTSSIGTGGKYTVAANNVAPVSFIAVGNQHKSADKTAINGVMANNVGVGIIRGKDVTNACAPPPAGDMLTVAANMSVPFPYSPFGGSGSNSSNWCVVGATGSVTAGSNAGADSNTIPGGHIGQSAWTQTDFRSNVAGISSLFTAFHPLPQPSWTPSGNPDLNTCVRGTFFTTGSCAPGDNGTFDLAPNKTFARTTTTILGNYSNVGALPHAGDNGGTVGDAYVAGGETCPPGQTAFCGASGTVWPAGVYIRDTPSAGNSTQWRNLGTVANPAVPPFIPGIAGLGAPLGSLTVAGGGASLGPQTPISDHDGYGWANPPSMGAYEVVGSLPFQCAHPGLQFNDACNAIHLDMKRE